MFRADICTDEFAICYGVTEVADIITDPMLQKMYKAAIVPLPRTTCIFDDNG